MNVENITLYIAVYAMILAAVNIFNSHINTPYILNPISDRVKYYNKCLNEVKKNLRLACSEKEIDSQINKLEWSLRIQKFLTFLYNIFVLMLWIKGTFSLISNNINTENLIFTLECVVYSSIILMFIGIAFRFFVWFFSDPQKTIIREKEALEESNNALKDNETIPVK